MRNKSWFKALRNLSWLTQFGLSLVVPPILCLLAASWLTRRFSLGTWVYFVALVFGLGAAACTFWKFLQMVQQRGNKK
ncbi:MAG: AtpZ/AtpI family protein [Ruthenibacterium sp.]